MTIEEQLERLTASVDKIAATAVTQADLQASEQRTVETLRAEAQASEQRLRAETEVAGQRTVDTLTEKMRDMQSEILRGLEGFAKGNFARMHILDSRTAAAADQIVATNDRITALE